MITDMRQIDEFANNPNMVFITDYKLALQILKNEYFEIPNLYQYLERLEEASGKSFEMTRCFVNASPFFLENSRHKMLRQIALEFLSRSNLKQWDAFFSEKIKSIINDLPLLGSFDLVANVGLPIFDRIARPLLGVFPSNKKDFDRIATVLQRMVEPMLPLKQRLQSESDFKYLIKMLEAATTEAAGQTNTGDRKLPTKSLLEQVQIDKPFDQLTCYAFVTAMYAAMAPLVQTTVNMLALIYSENNGKALTVAQFEDQFDFLFHLSTAPRYIHRISKKKILLEGLEINEGMTVLIDIQQAVIKSEVNNKIAKQLDFGFGTHFCVGAMLSKRILKELVPMFMARFTHLNVLHKVADDELNIAYAYKQILVSPVNVPH